MECIRIVPPDSENSGPTRVQGTRIFVGDEEVSGVVSVKLSAEVGGLWRAEIVCHPKMLPMDNIASTARYTFKAPLMWRFKQWLRGARPY